MHRPSDDDRGEEGGEAGWQHHQTGLDRAQAEHGLKPQRLVGEEGPGRGGQQRCRDQEGGKRRAAEKPQVQHWFALPVLEEDERDQRHGGGAEQQQAGRRAPGASDEGETSVAAAIVNVSMPGRSIRRGSGSWTPAPRHG